MKKLWEQNRSREVQGKPKYKESAKKDREV